MKKVKKFKYDWRAVPDHINFLATYEGGETAWGYVNKPVPVKLKTWYQGAWNGMAAEWRHRVPVAPYRGHWTQSLEKRPSKAQLVEWVLNGAIVV